MYKVIFLFFIFNGLAAQCDAQRLKVMLLKDGNILYYVRGMEMKGKSSHTGVLDMTYIHQDTIPKTVRVNLTIESRRHGGLPDSVLFEETGCVIPPEVKSELFYIDTLNRGFRTRASYRIPVGLFKECFLVKDLSLKVFYGSDSYRFKHKRREKKYYNYILEEFEMEFGWNSKS